MIGIELLRHSFERFAFHGEAADTRRIGDEGLPFVAPLGDRTAHAGGRVLEHAGEQSPAEERPAVGLDHEVVPYRHGQLSGRADMRAQRGVVGRLIVREARVAREFERERFRIAAQNGRIERADALHEVG